MLKRFEPMIGTIRCTLEWDVHPNQNGHMKTRKAPTMTADKRTSGLS